MGNWLKSDRWTRTVGEVLKLLDSKSIGMNQATAAIDLIESFYKTKCPAPKYTGVDADCLFMEFSAEEGVFWEITIDKNANCGILILPRKERKNVVDSIIEVTRKENYE